MLIGVDIDEVLADTLPAFLAFHNRVFSSTWQLEHFTTTAWNRVMGLPNEVMVERVGAFFDSEHFHRLPTVPGATEAIAALTEEHELVIVSSRWGRAAAATEAWLHHNFRGHFAAVHFSANHHSVELTAGKLSKAGICRKLGAELMIEDAPVYARECQAAGVQPLILTRPWNILDVVPGALRAGSWPEVLEVIAGHARGRPR